MIAHVAGSVEKPPIFFFNSAVAPCSSIALFWAATIRAKRLVSKNVSGVSGGARKA